VDARSERFSAEGLDGVHLRVLQWGDPSARKLILLHGGGANSHWWSHLAPPLARLFHVLALDFRGHGESDHPTELVVGAFNDDLDALLSHLGTREVSLVGHSMGGHVALDHASRNPATRSLALIDISRGAGRRSGRATRLALALRRSYPTAEEAIRRFRFVPEARHATEALRASIAEASLRQEADGRFSYAFDRRWFGVPARPRPELSNVRCRTLLLRGSESPLLTREGANEIVAELPNAELCEIPEAGHHAQIDQPQRVLDALTDFLRPDC
jgi:pimeloyl-ACP methyl ester carboxylesterase